MVNVGVEIVNRPKNSLLTIGCYLVNLLIGNTVLGGNITAYKLATTKYVCVCRLFEKDY